MNIEITRVITPDDIDTIVGLAREIWQQHFTPIIGAEQVEYMLEKFQSEKAISSQIYEGGFYYRANVDNESIGYVGIIPELNTDKLMLSKIYVKQSKRGIGVGKNLLAMVERQCLTMGKGVIWLTVNRYNDETISWYKYHGFEVVDEVKKDIGGGFFMDDYIMAKKCQI